MNNLIISNISKSFNKLQVLTNISINLEANKVYAIIGPNGSGKTTLLNCITGIYKPDSGSILYNGIQLTRLDINQISNLGIKRTYQNIKLNSDMTVAENIFIGNYFNTHQNIFDIIFKTKRYHQNEQKTWNKVYTLAEEFNLINILHKPVNRLSYVNKKKIEILRALISSPKLLILDEPAAGLNEAEKLELTSIISKIKNKSLTIILIEHDLQLIKTLANKILVLHHGNKIAYGDFNNIISNKEVIDAYIGETNA